MTRRADDERGDVRGRPAAAGPAHVITLRPFAGRFDYSMGKSK